MLSALLFVLALAGASASPTAESLVFSHVQNKLSMDLLKQLSSPGRNTFFSPSSISSVLSMVYLGAAGATEKELFNFLGYNQAGIQNREEVLSASRELIQRSVQNQNVTFDTASMVIASNTQPVLASYVRELKVIFDAEVRQVDFANDSGKVVQETNKWVGDRTRGKITSVLDDVPSDVKMLLLNVVYFKGKWRHQFHKGMTKKMPFYNDGKQKVLVDTMTLNAALPYYRSGKLEAQVIKMPYVGSGYSAIVMLPFRNEGINILVEQLSSSVFRETTSNLRMTETELQLPRFKIESVYKLKPTLKKMGLDSVFGSRSNLSRIDGTRDLYVSEVFHKAYLEVEEEGSEAAAATTIVIKTKSLRRTPVVHVDHPFVFCILSEHSGEIMFVGAVNRL